MTRTIRLADHPREDVLRHIVDSGWLLSDQQPRTLMEVDFEGVFHRSAAILRLSINGDMLFRSQYDRRFAHRSTKVTSNDETFLVELALMFGETE